MEGVTEPIVYQKQHLRNIYYFTDEMNETPDLKTIEEYY